MTTGAPGNSDDDPIQRAIETAPEVEKDDGRQRSCPITPLGHDGNLTFYYQTGAGDVIALQSKEHNGFMNLVALFGGDDWWQFKHFPITKTRKAGPDGEETVETVGWSIKAVGQWLIHECHARGRFDIERDLRGLGVWRLEYPKGRKKNDPAIVVHLGDALWFGQFEPDGEPRLQPLGRIGRHVYVAHRALPRPAREPLPQKRIAELAMFLKTWNWSRPNIDPVLLVGWLGVAMLIGAIDWRPSLWLVGDRATGKTTLQTLIRKLVGEQMQHLSDTTEAGLRQILRGSARPVSLDEIEADENNSRALDVVKLQRISATREAGVIVRGDSQGGGAKLYNIETAIFYSSIGIPPLDSADLRRIAMLVLGELPARPDEGAKAAGPRDMVESFADMGPGLLRRIVEGWDRFEETLELFRRRLSHHNHAAGACDQFGTLLACAWVLLRPGVPKDDAALDVWALELDPRMLAASADDRADHERCLTKLLSSRDLAWRDGHQKTIAELIRIGAGLGPESRPKEAPPVDDQGNARRDLMRIGLKVILAGSEDQGWLAISNSHEGLAKLFDGSKWATKSGKTGGWVVPLLRLPGAMTSRDKAVKDALARGVALDEAKKLQGTERFGDLSTRAVMIPLQVLDFAGETL